MFSLELVLLYCKVTRMKYPKSNSIHREIRSLRPVVTKLAECGTLIQELKFKCWMVMKMKFSHVLSIMREIP